MPERVYLFLDCSDIRRIRENLKTGGPKILAIWNADRSQVDAYSVPATYSAGNSADVLWWGQGNYIAQDMALIYLVTGERDYAIQLRSLLDVIRKDTHYGSSLGTYNEDVSGGLLSNPRYGNMPYSSLVFAYLSIRDTDLFTDQGRQDFDDFFIQQGFLDFEVLSRRGGQVTLDSWINRNVPHGAAIVAATMAAAFPDNPRSRELYDKVRPILDWQIANWWHPDGGWGEDSESYGFHRMEGLLTLAEALKKNMDIDMYQIDYGGKTLGTLCRHYVDILTPEGMSPALNDTANYYMDPGILRLCAYRTNDPQLAFAADNYRWGWEHAYGRSQLGGDTMLGEIAWWGLPPKPQEPDFTSIASSSTGFAILRSDWGHLASYLLLQFTASKVHQDRSFGALYLYDGGPWMVGNGYHENGQSTVQHSTISFGGLSQTETGGSLLDLADLDQTGLISVEGHPYPDSTHTRTVAWIKPWHQWLVWDDARVFDARVRSLQLRWFILGTWADQQDNVWTFSRSKGNPTSLTVAMYPAGPAQYKKVERHYDWEEWVSNAVGVEMDTPVKQSSARLITALTSAKNVPVVSREDEGQGTVLTSTLDQAAWQWIIPSQKGAAEIGPYSTDGIAGCLHQNGNELQGYCLLHGKDLTGHAQDFVKSSVPLDFEADLENSQVTINVPSDASVSFYWPNAVTSIKNGTTPIQFLQQQPDIQLTLTAGKYVLKLQ
jgi:hypothetical protein